MYLSRLDSEKQELFLELCIHASLTNENLTEEEKSMIDAYCLEMGLPKSDYIARKELNDVLVELKRKCSSTEINIIMIEISALMMSENIYDKMEQDFMKSLQEKLNVSDEKQEKFISAIEELMKAYSMLNELL